MKKIQFPSVFIFSFLLIAFFSCNDEPLEGEFGGNNGSGNNGGGNNNQAGEFRVDFDNQTFVADQISATRTDDVINITGLRGANQEAVILTINETTTGIYQFGIVNGVDLNAATYSEANGSTNVWVSLTDGMTSQGQITISEIDATNLTMTGTFNFTGTNNAAGSKEFTNGSFTNISFDDGLTNNNDNTFFANVDGVEFVEDMIAGVELSLGGNTTIGISATKNNGETIGFSLDANITPGDYSFDGFGSSFNVSQYIGDLNTDIYVGDGTFTIISHDTANNNIVGTFNFVANPVQGGASLNVTDGSFNVTYF